NLEFAVDRQRCARWNVTPDDLLTVLETAVAGKAVTQMVEGEKTFDITLRWPDRLRKDETTVLQIPVEVAANHVKSPHASRQPAAPTPGGSQGLSSTGTFLPLPALTGSLFNAPNLPNAVPRSRLGDLVTSPDPTATPGTGRHFIRPGASMITREQGQRFIAVK